MDSLNRRRKFTTLVQNSKKFGAQTAEEAAALCKSSTAIRAGVGELCPDLSMDQLPAKQGKEYFMQIEKR